MDNRGLVALGVKLTLTLKELIDGVVQCSKFDNDLHKVAPRRN